jgi:hypothetical protein
MSELIFVGKLKPKPFLSLQQEEKMRIEEIKKRILKEKSIETLKKDQSSVNTDLTYERDKECD